MSLLTNNLMRYGYLKNQALIDAFNQVHRIEFVPEHLERDADADIPLERWLLCWNCFKWKLARISWI